MHKIKIIIIGKTKEKWLQDALADYQSRLVSHYQITWLLAKDDQKLLSLAIKPYIALDPNGTPHTSTSFSAFLNQTLQTTFIIGGPLGLPAPILQNATHTISLSPLTFTHQLTRLILLEQLYRANQIHLGTPYHK